MQKHRVLKRGEIQSVSDWEPLTTEELARYGEEVKSKAEPDALAVALAKAQQEAKKRFSS